MTNYKYYPRICLEELRKQKIPDRTVRRIATTYFLINDTHQLHRLLTLGNTRVFGTCLILTFTILTELLAVFVSTSRQMFKILPNSSIIKSSEITEETPLNNPPEKKKHNSFIMYSKFGKYWRGCGHTYPH
jgi:hypothetical protein